MILRFANRLVTGLLLLFVVLAVTVKVRYGGGAADFPDRTGEPLLSESALEVVAELPLPPGNIAVSAGGRVFITLHPEARPNVKVVEVVGGALRPFPNLEFQTGETEPRYFRSPLSLRIDRQNRLWILDNAHHGFATPRLLAFDIARGTVLHEYEFPREIAGRGSHLNDFQVSLDGKHIYIAEASIFAKTPALVVYDVEAKTARRVLEGDVSVMPGESVPLVQGREMKVLGLFSIRPGVDSIALDAAGAWLYFAAVNSPQMYRARTADLLNKNLSGAELVGKVELFAQKTMSDGLTADAAGNIYLSDPEHSAIVLLKPDRSLQTLVKTDRLRWPDGFSFGPDGWLYVTCSALQHVIGRPPASISSNAPYQIFRVRAPAAGTPGH